MHNQDLLTGGKNTFAIDVDTFYQYWMPSQRNNVHSVTVDAYKKKILSGSEVEAPLLQSVELTELGEYCIRTLDGRHRMAAAKAAGIKTIYVRMSDELIGKIEKIFPGVILRDNLQKQNNLMEDDVEEDSYEEDLKFFEQFVANKKKMQMESPVAPMNFSALAKANHPIFSSATSVTPAERSPAEIIMMYLGTPVSN